MKTQKSHPKIESISMLSVNSEELKEINKIVENLGFDHKADLKSRDILHELIESKFEYLPIITIQNIINEISSKRIILIFGGGPDSIEFFKIIKNNDKFIQIINEKCYIVAIDGSYNLLKKYNLTPDLVFTDLDGIEYNKIKLDKELEKVPIVIHAHGDNINKLEEFSEFISKHPLILGTTQSNSRANIINYGGFTDGDRALYFLKNLISNKIKILLIGYDFGKIIGMYSKPNLRSNFEGDHLKIMKLNYGIQLMNKICSKYKKQIFVLTIKYKSKLACKQIKIGSYEQFNKLIMDL